MDKIHGNLRNCRAIGTEYETMACEYLIQQGYQILQRNFRCRQGEIDVIAKENEYLVFVEVKYRRSGQDGDPAEAVDARKQARILHTARYYMAFHHMPENTPCRFDVVAVLGSTIRLIRDAFWCG